MKEIKAYIRTERADEVLQALGEVGIVHATLTHVQAVGGHVDVGHGKVSFEYGRRVSPMVKLETICLDRDEARVMESIRTAACTGEAGDGVISVANVNRLVKIRNAAESTDAL